MTRIMHENLHKGHKQNNIKVVKFVNFYIEATSKRIINYFHVTFASNHLFF